MSSILTVEDLRVRVDARTGTSYPVNGVSFDLRRGETLGLVGESGSGKSLTSMSLTRLLPTRAVKIDSGSIHFDGQDVRAMSGRALRSMRGRRIATIFQEPMTALNPAFTIGNQVAEPLRRHLRLSIKQAKRRVVELLDMVGIPRPERIIHDYPHQLSGGMRQRVMIAMAMSCEPDVLIADEPTTALDVTTQAQILDLMLDLQLEHGMAILLVTHDLGVIAQTCSRVVVMKKGEFVEKAAVEDIFDAPKHPYTKALLESMPSRNRGKDRLPYIREGVLSE